MTMKKTFAYLAACLMSFSLMSGPAQAAQPTIDTSELTGTVKLACEALLCLSSSSRPGECSPSLDHYFGIKKDKWSDTLDARKDFLNLCPASSEPGMPSLVNAIADGAGFCDAASLNRNIIPAYRVYSKANRSWDAWRDGDAPDYPTCSSYDTGGNYNWGRNNRWDNENDYSECVERKQVIDDRMPSRCLNYLNHELTYFDPLHYIGSKYEGGKWVDQ